MTYFISDIHGAYEPFLRLLDVIEFSDADTLYVLGDIIDKGANSVKLLNYIRRTPNIEAIFGNHEFDFLKYYYGLMRQVQSPDDIDGVLSELREYFPRDSEVLSWEAVDYVETLPLYIETDDFICVHAGVETDKNGVILPMNKQRAEVIIYSRDFKDGNFLLANANKTVLFGHTPCMYENGSGKFVKTPKSGILSPCKLTDYAKIRLDCSPRFVGVLRAEDMREFYLPRTLT